MKKLFALLGIAAATALAVEPFSLVPGENASPRGEVAAFEAVTASNAASLKVAYVISVRETTNAVAQYVSVSNGVTVTNTLFVPVPGNRYVVTNTLFDANASSHYLMATNPALKFLSGQGAILVTGAQGGDKLTLFIK